MRKAADDAREARGSAGMTRSCRLGFGMFPAELAVGINLLDVLAHTWDIAAPVGVDLDQDHHLWRVGLDAAQDVIGPDRDSAHYGPEVQCRDLLQRRRASAHSSGVPRTTIPDCRLAEVGSRTGCT
jgi:hypothetical protein